MAKVRFYSDVPEYKTTGFHLYASTSPSGQVATGFKRIAFDVDMPPDAWKPYDFAAPAGAVSVVDAPEPEQE